MVLVDFFFPRFLPLKVATVGTTELLSLVVVDTMLEVLPLVLAYTVLTVPEVLPLVLELLPLVLA